MWRWSKDFVNVDYTRSGEAVESRYETQRLPVVRAVVNAVIYLHSRDPEILGLRPLHELSHKKRRAYRKTGQPENHCTVPLTLVNWDYHGRVWLKDETSVQAHMRWQPCGPQRSEVRLVWVREHLRRYKQDSGLSESG